MLTGKTVVVTGGAGFIGSHVTRLLSKEGATVRIFDSNIEGQRDRIPEGVSVVEGDIRNDASREAAFQGADAIVHLAAVVSVPVSVVEPVETYDVNVLGFLKVLDYVRGNGSIPVVYASSAAVYGNEPSLPKREDSPTDPRSPYALSKLENEQIAKLYSAAYGVGSVGLRFFNVYGPGQSADHAYASVIPKWIKILSEGKDPEVYGDGTQTRDFVHVRDVAVAVVRALESLPKTANVYNVASGTEVSLLELFERLREKWPERTLVQKPPREGDVLKSVADVSKAKTELGFSATVSLEEGIRELLP